ncbi:FkbM family methyltransferase [Actinokineospora sp.]|uniref:FkbM family methyltransferase n=1 Tax=Actinokineospora sp. TaxID=1872133 RepID=UPI004037DEFB
MSSWLSGRRVTAAVSFLAARVPDRVFAAAVARTYHRFEPELSRLADFCPDHGTALDIGAWYGPWSRAFARRLDRVVAVEPNPAVANLLTRTVPGSVRVVQAAVSDQVGDGTLFVPRTGMGTEGTASLLTAAADGSTATAVATTTIDTLAVDDVTMIKMDVEGVELAALHGAAKTLAAQHPVLMIELEYRRSPVDEVVEYLAGYGYQGEVLVDGHWRGLGEFDLAGHQARVAPLIEGRGYLATIRSPEPRYVNNVVFRPC